MVSRNDVTEAARRIGGRIRRTPLLKVDSGVFPGEQWFKCDYLQHTGSFKARGAFNRILSAQERGELDPETGIVIASGGNAGLANAFVAREVGVPATVFVPVSAPAIKVARLHAYGAEVKRAGSEYALAQEAAVQHATNTGALLCHAYDQPEVVAGAGTAGREILDQLDGGVDTIVVAVGGGGLMAGVGAAVDGEATVVAVEPTTVPTLHEALKHGEPVDVDVGGIAADSLGARRIGDIALAVAQRTGVRSVLVSDEDIIAARRFLWDRWRIVVEHGAAAALAALTSGAYAPRLGERLVVLLCAADTDPTDLHLDR